MSAKKPVRMFPTWRGIMRPGYGAGGDLMRGHDSLLAAHSADIVISENISRISACELPMCWNAAYRGALRRLNENAWKVQLDHFARKNAS